MAPKKFKVIEGSQFADNIGTYQKIKTVVYGREGNDSLNITLQSPYSNALYGNQGDDQIYFRGGYSIVSGDEGNDSFLGFLVNKGKVLGGAGDDYIAVESRFSYVEKITGAVVDGGDGNDRLGYLTGITAKKVQVYGGSGDDVLEFSASVDPKTYFDLGLGNDKLYLSEVPYAKDIIIRGGEGSDFADISSEYTRNSLIGITKNESTGVYALQFARYRNAEGITYTQTVELPGFEGIIRGISGEPELFSQIA
jgi:Ca2+-binding RTX toxin-like protein